MRVILVDKQAKQATIFSCKSELSRLIGVSSQTLWNWSKDKIKETEKYFIYFDIQDSINKRLRRNKTLF